MSLNPDIRDQAYQFFIEEARELLQVLETGLLELRQDHSTAKVHELMRAAHSIKGGAASVELGAIGLLAHRLEDFFKALYSDEVDFDAELEGLLLQGYDCLSDPLLAQIEAGAFDEEAALLKAEPVFAALEERLSEALKNADNYIPSSNDLGVDIVSSIFEVDVVQALEHLQAVAANHHDRDPAAELEGTLEMFAGFAELFNLPGFSDIVQTARTALENNPNHALAILKATVNDCTQATEQVLAGDREQGGTVSQALKELARSRLSSESATEATVFEGDLWSDSLNDFGSILEVDSDSASTDPEQIWSTTEAEAKIFGDMIQESIAEEFTETAAKVDEIGQIFDALSEQTIEDTTDTDERNLWADFTEFPQVEASESTSERVDDISQIFDLVADGIETNTEAEIWSMSDLQPQAEDIGQILDPGSSQPESTLVEAEVEADGTVDWGEIPDADGLWSNISDADSVFADIVSLTDKQPKIEPTEQSNNSTVDNSTNITAAIESVTDSFDSLSVAEVDSFLPPTKKLAKPTPAPKPSTPQKAAAKLSVRVDLERLERMNNLVGELTINRNSLALQNEQLQSNVSELERKFLRFRGVTKQLQEVSDRMLLEDSRNLTPSIFTNSAIADFDNLELDSYSQLHSALQTILEEIVQLEESVEDIAIFAGQSDRAIDSQRQMLGQMRDELMWVRMLPLERILQRFPRTLRDLSSKHHKPVELKLNGTGVLVDKAVLEKLSDPLLHLLRNSFDHGIEDSQTRLQQGKSATGTIEIRAYYQGNQTVIEVQDDGRGLDLQRIIQTGIERGLITAESANRATREQLFELIFEPGFSTASKVSELSGRGVGMNIVRSQVESLKGKINVTSTPGVGSTFTLRLPLTLTIAKLLVCSLGETAFAIPSDSIEEIIIPEAEQLKVTNGEKFLSLNGRLVPIYSLQKLLAYNCPLGDRYAHSNAFKTIAPPEDWASPLLLLRRGQKLFALEVVSLLSEQELVIKPYGKAIAPPIYSYGCTILSDGSLIPAFDGSALIGMILGEERPAISSVDLGFDVNENIEESEVTALKTIMVVDDSTALRRTMALTLEKEGYRVVQKKDGKEALNGFKQHPELDLIICDVEMPVMNGFEFLGMRRRDSALARIPTFMLTSRSGTKHRNLAKQLGADGYFTKPYVEQEFIREVKQILESSTHQLNTPAAIAIKTKTILVIDDSSALRRTLALTLEHKGYRVLQARDGNEGLEQLRSNLQTDLVICDIEMPNVNGFEFLTMRRKEPQLTNVPVVMLTSRGSEKHRNLAISLGAAGFFTKPYVEDKFVAEIERYIRS